jgi:hypothetical protein
MLEKHLPVVMPGRHPSITREYFTRRQIIAHDGSDAERSVGSPWSFPAAE